MTNETMNKNLSSTSSESKTLILASFLLGFGLGGFIDGIVLHQLLQWHHMIANLVPTNTLAGLETNTVADGVFNAGMFMITVVGLSLLWQSIKQNPYFSLSTRAFIGWNLIGWGGFNLFDSVVFHAILRLHHIRQVPNFIIYDIGFFLIGGFLILAGIVLTRKY
ncbi:MAG: DUF2243 domain-containing protein [Lyngbya sp.]|nr:DUF2243 domain-containing protein [Lyngbya sp.]